MDVVETIGKQRIHSHLSAIRRLGLFKDVHKCVVLEWWIVAVCHFFVTQIEFKLMGVQGN